MAICWRHSRSIWIGAHGLLPTHWRPLPAPPSLAGEAPR
jgi:hypothetical protein